MDFNLTDLKINNDNIMRDNIIAPHNFDKMKEIAKSLSGAFPFVESISTTWMGASFLAS